MIAWELEAQVGIGRAVEAMPSLVADTLLDHFEVTLRPGVDLTGLDGPDRPPERGAHR